MKITCPHCGDSTDQWGMQIIDVWDGVLIWRCDSCGIDRPRFDPGDRRYDAAVKIIRGWHE